MYAVSINYRSRETLIMYAGLPLSYFRKLIESWIILRRKRCFKYYGNPFFQNFNETKDQILNFNVIFMNEHITRIFLWSSLLGTVSLVDYCQKLSKGWEGNWGNGGLAKLKSNWKVSPRWAGIKHARHRNCNKDSARRRWGCRKSLPNRLI